MKVRIRLGVGVLRGLVLSVGVATTVLAVQPVGAQILLKPRGQDARPLRAKTVAADITIAGRFATTRSTMVFQNETAERTEAEFIYTVPPHAVMTYFAYWYHDERVVARVVEKERAAAIYRHITSRMRDPALIELVGKNTFRARIFPIEPNADLKIEMHMVQVLPTVGSNPVYRFPLKPQLAGSDTLEQVKINVLVSPDPSLARVSSNYKLPVETTTLGYRLQLAEKNYRPKRDLDIELVSKPQALQATHYAARSGGTDGFFAVALVPNRSLNRPRVAISGLRTYDVLADQPRRVRAGQVVTVYGRYKGSGGARISLVGATPQGRWIASRTLHFGGERSDNNLATKLWAARNIEKLSVNSRNREKIVAVSKRFTLPSKFTSWLAVPREELKRFWREKLAADIAVAGRQLSFEIADGRGNGRTARQLRARFNALLRQGGSEYSYQPGSSLAPYLDSTMQELAAALQMERNRSRPNRRRVATLRRQIARLARAGGGGNRTVEPLYIIEEDLRIAQRQLQREIARGRGRSRKARQLRQKTTRLSQRFDEAVNAPVANNWGGGGGFRGGDPLISIEAPPDTERVVALMPGGDVKQLQLNTDSGKWEARFDIPMYAAEGHYDITIIVVLKDGTRQTLTLRYRVDWTVPQGRGQAQIVAGDAANGTPTARLELDATEDTTRVVALLPWEQKVELKPSTIHAHRFFALVPVPQSQRGKAAVVTYILTDKAHNRTTVTVDMTR